MPLVTGTFGGTTVTQEDLYIEGAPFIYYQDSEADLAYGPDDDGFYWGLTGTTSHPVYALGCYQDVRFSDGVEVNAVRCDNIGDVSVVQKRTHLELNFNLLSLFPLSSIVQILKGGGYWTDHFSLEKMGLGEIDNSTYFHVYFPRVYDVDAYDYVAVTGHRCKFVDAWEMTMPFATPWTIGVTIWMMADTSLPSNQQFATIIRRDPSAI